MFSKKGKSVHQQWWRKWERPLLQIWARWKQVGECHLEMQSRKDWSQEHEKKAAALDVIAPGSITDWYVAQGGLIEGLFVKLQMSSIFFFLVLN